MDARRWQVWADLATGGLDENEVSGSSVAMGMLGFLLLFTVAVIAYVARLPRAEQQPVIQH